MSSKTVVALPSGWKPAGRPQLVVSIQRQPAHRRWLEAIGLFDRARQHLDERWTTPGSRPCPPPAGAARAPPRGHGLVIRPLGGQRVEVVDDRQDARAERDLVASQALRIALAVPALVVAQDERRDRIRKWHGADDFGSDLRVQPDLLKLLLRQRSGLGRMCSGTASLPMSCSSAAVLTPWISLSGMPSDCARPAA